MFLKTYEKVLLTGTGLRRYLFATLAALKTLVLRQDDIIYDPLPLYHTTGGNLGLGCALIAGIPVVIRGKFSASAYFPDCAKYGCTVGGSCVLAQHQSFRNEKRMQLFSNAKISLTNFTKDKNRFCGEF